MDFVTAIKKLKVFFYRTVNKKEDDKIGNSRKKKKKKTWLFKNNLCSSIITSGHLTIIRGLGINALREKSVRNGKYSFSIAQAAIVI